MSQERDPPAAGGRERAGARGSLVLVLGLALLAMIAVGAVIAVRSGRGAGPTATTTASTGVGPFLTAAAMPPGLGARAVPRFALTDARAGRFSSAALRGRPYLITFLYVHCVDVCPLIGSEIHDALATLGARASGLDVVAISVDPRGDTRAAVKRWLAVHHEPANFHYLIGSPRQLAPVWKAFFVSPQTPGDPHSTHSAVIWLINRHGRLAALIPAGVPINTAGLAHDLGVLTTTT
jgi:protein SCO1/2